MKNRCPICGCEDIIGKTECPSCRHSLIGTSTKPSYDANKTSDAKYTSTVASKVTVKPSSSSSVKNTNDLAHANANTKMPAGLKAAIAIIISVMVLTFVIPFIVAIVFLSKSENFDDLFDTDGYESGHEVDYVYPDVDLLDGVWSYSTDGDEEYYVFYPNTDNFVGYYVYMPDADCVYYVIYDDDDDTVFCYDIDDGDVYLTDTSFEEFHYYSSDPEEYNFNILPDLPDGTSIYD